MLLLGQVQMHTAFQPPITLRSNDDSSRVHFGCDDKTSDLGRTECSQAERHVQRTRHPIPGTDVYIQRNLAASVEPDQLASLGVSRKRPS